MIASVRSYYQLGQLESQMLSGHVWRNSMRLKFQLSSEWEKSERSSRMEYQVAEGRIKEEREREREG